MGSYGNDSSSYGSSMNSDCYENNELPSPRSAYGHNSNNDNVNPNNMDSEMGSGRSSRFERCRDNDVHGSSNFSSNNNNSNNTGVSSSYGSNGGHRSEESLDSTRTDRSNYGRCHETSGSGGLSSARCDNGFTSNSNSYNNSSSNGGGGVFLGASDSDGKKDNYNRENNTDQSFSDRMTDKVIDAAADYAKKQW